jgi:hypothetical protein
MVATSTWNVATVTKELKSFFSIDLNLHSHLLSVLPRRPHMRLPGHQLSGHSSVELGDSREASRNLKSEKGHWACCQFLLTDVPIYFIITTHRVSQIQARGWKASLGRSQICWSQCGFLNTIIRHLVYIRVLQTESKGLLTPAMENERSNDQS